MEYRRNPVPTVEGDESWCRMMSDQTPFVLPTASHVEQTWRWPESPQGVTALDHLVLEYVRSVP